MTLSGDTGSKANTVFARPQLEAAAYGPDGVLLKTSVCDEIEESVKKAAEIEKQLANSKVLVSVTFLLFFSAVIMLYYICYIIYVYLQSFL